MKNKLPLTDNSPEWIENAQTESVSERLDRVVKYDDRQKTVWTLYSLIAQELGIDRRSGLKEIIEATVKHYEEHKKVMADYQEIIKSKIN